MTTEEINGYADKAAELTVTITITPEQAAAMVETFKETLAKIAEWAREVLQKVAEAAKKAVHNFMEQLLYAANDHPKWWRLYKHAKKWRPRKKYRRRLMQQLLRKLEDARKEVSA